MYDLNKIVEQNREAALAGFAVDGAVGGNPRVLVLDPETRDVIARGHVAELGRFQKAARNGTVLLVLDISEE